MDDAGDDEDGGAWVIGAVMLLAFATFFAAMLWFFYTFGQQMASVVLASPLAQKAAGVAFAAFIMLRWLSRKSS